MFINLIGLVITFIMGILAIVATFPDGRKWIRSNYRKFIALISTIIKNTSFDPVLVFVALIGLTQKTFESRAT